MQPCDESGCPGLPAVPISSEHALGGNLGLVTLAPRPGWDYLFGGVLVVRDHGIHRRIAHALSVAGWTRERGRRTLLFDFPTGFLSLLPQHQLALERLLRIGGIIGARHGRSLGGTANTWPTNGRMTAEPGRFCGDVPRSQSPSTPLDPPAEGRAAVNGHSDSEQFVKNNTEKE